MSDEVASKTEETKEDTPAKSEYAKNFMKMMEEFRSEISSLRTEFESVREAFNSQLPSAPEKEEEAMDLADEEFFSMLRGEA